MKGCFVFGYPVLICRFDFAADLLKFFGSVGLFSSLSFDY